MNVINLHTSIGEKDIDELIKRYHFNSNDIYSYMGIAKILQSLLKIQGYYEWVTDDIITEYDSCLVGFMTIGEGIDKLQELYSQYGGIEEEYLIDCLGSIILMKNYELFIQEIQKRTGMWVEKIEFLGDKYSIELLPKLHEICKPENISYTSDYILIPKKSVSFLLPLSDRPSNNPCNICTNCENQFCIFKKSDSDNSVHYDNPEVIPDESEDFVPNTYGYMQIFNKTKE